MGKLALGGSALLGVVVLLGSYLYRRVWSWKRVGVIDSIKLYPLKSAAPFSVASAYCGQKGLIWRSKTVTLSDRMFVIYDGFKKTVITSRTYPEILKIRTEPGSEVDTVVFTHPKRQDSICIHLPEDDVNTQPLGMKFPTTDTEEMTTFDCGDEVAAWFSKTIHCCTARLGFWPPQLERDITTARAREFGVFKLLHNKYTGAYSNLSSYLLLNKSSVQDLQSRLKPGVKVFEDNFRANLTILGAKPYAEDNWAKITVGETACFRVIKNCVRCVLITINPITLEMDQNFEPLKTLKTYRQLVDKAERTIEGDAPVMGCYMGLESSGDIKVGDEVYATAYH